MTSAQEKLGRRIAKAMLYIEFSARLMDGRRVQIEGREVLRRAPYVESTVAHVEVRHPQVKRDGVQWLVGLIDLEVSPPRLTYGVPVYRDAIERALARVVGA